MVMQSNRESTDWEAHRARQEVTRRLQRIKELTHELHSLEQRGGPDVDLMEQELERLRWRLAVVVRKAAGAAA
jgi:ABC-type phosphate transport system auxiliary subunit